MRPSPQFPCYSAAKGKKFRCRADLQMIRKILVKKDFWPSKGRFSIAETNFSPAVRERPESATAHLCHHGSASGMNGGSVDTSSHFDTRHIADTPDAMAPDGSEVRLLCSLPRGSMAAFRLAPGSISRAVAHRTVEEIWCFTAGHGRMWRRFGDREEITEIAPGVSITIPTGMHFQFRCDGGEPLEAVAVTMPPWPGADEAFVVPGQWEPTV
jgi:mannose-6-phosphate isomerase-like protein (cupin superfamily)